MYARMDGRIHEQAQSNMPLSWGHKKQSINLGAKSIDRQIDLGQLHSSTSARIALLKNRKKPSWKDLQSDREIKLAKWCRASQ